MTASTDDIQINPAAPDDIPDVVAFVMAARGEMFPMLDPTFMPDDLRHFQRSYLDEDGGLFLIARHAGQVVGAIGFLPYDGRFPQLHYERRKVVEVVRLFIDPDFRRLGLAARLVERLKDLALMRRVDVLYLHTHPFLNGAIAFWQRQGFALIDVEDDPVWRTTHLHWLL